MILAKLTIIDCFMHFSRSGNLIERALQLSLCIHKKRNAASPPFDTECPFNLPIRSTDFEWEVEGASLVLVERSEKRDRRNRLVKSIPAKSERHNRKTVVERTGSFPPPLPFPPRPALFIPLYRGQVTISRCLAASFSSAYIDALCNRCWHSREDIKTIKKKSRFLNGL